MLCYKPLSAYSNKNARNFVMCRFFVCTYACTYIQLCGWVRSLCWTWRLFSFKSVFRSDKSLLKNTRVIYCCYVSVHIHFSIFLFIYWSSSTITKHQFKYLQSIGPQRRPKSVHSRLILHTFWFRRSAFIPPTNPLKTTPTAFLLWRWRWNSAKLFSRKMIILTASEWKKNLVSPCYAFLDRPSSATTTTAAKPSPLTRIFTFRVFKYLKYYDTGRINCYYYFLDVIN